MDSATGCGSLTASCRRDRPAPSRDPPSSPARSDEPLKVHDPAGDRNRDRGLADRSSRAAPRIPAGGECRGRVARGGTYRGKRAGERGATAGNGMKRSCRRRIAGLWEVSELLRRQLDDVRADRDAWRETAQAGQRLLAPPERRRWWRRNRSLRGPGSLAATWPQGFDAAMSRTHLGNAGRIARSSRPVPAGTTFRRKMRRSDIQSSSGG
jgi:hypothetical protein